jgi:hypothetical protein
MAGDTSHRAVAQNGHPEDFASPHFPHVQERGPLQRAAGAVKGARFAARSSRPFYVRGQGNNASDPVSPLFWVGIEEIIVWQTG